MANLNGFDASQVDPSRALEPLPAGRWLLHARDHLASAWRPVCGTRDLAAALAIVCSDESRVYWP